MTLNNEVPPPFHEIEAASEDMECGVCHETIRKGEPYRIARYDDGRPGFHFMRYHPHHPVPDYYRALR